MSRRAVVVGAGPNGLSAAVELARNGLKVTVLEAAEEVGGGTRSDELTVPGLIHDHCSAFHPMAVGSPALRGIDVGWAWPEVDLAHPLDDGSAGVMVRSIEATAAGLGRDGAVWRRLFAAPSRAFPSLTADLLGPVAHLPSRPLALARFGVLTLPPAVVLARAFHTERARAMWGGAAAHSFSPLHRPLSSAVGVALICASHAYGWPVAVGGSRSIASGLVRELERLGGRVETGRRVDSLDSLEGFDLTLLDLAPSVVADLAGSRLPAGVARAYRRYRHGPGAFKVDFAVEGGVPWTNEACRRAGTVHAAGTFEEIVRGESEVNAGRMPASPFVLVGQQFLADGSRSAGDVHPVWAYAHVPSGYAGDATDAVLGQIERFAPGLRERIVGGVTSRGPGELAAWNESYVGGDIINGANTPLQTLFRPRITLKPYSTQIPGVYICSAATPPGAGAHGMSGWLAARAALKALR